jgi:hypothetical protein
VSETVDPVSGADEMSSRPIHSRTGPQRSGAVAGTDKAPSDTITDSGVEGGVDAPNEGTDEDPDDEEVSAN